MMGFLDSALMFFGWIATLIGSLVVAYFALLMWFESPKWAWKKMFAHPWDIMQMRRRVRKLFENDNVNNSNLMVEYSKFDVGLTKSMYQKYQDPETVGFDPETKPPFRMSDFRFKKEDFEDEVGPDLKSLISKDMLRGIQSPNEIRKKDDDGNLGSDHGDG